MHRPLLKTKRTRIGVTGDIRFRRQMFTGVQVLQVAVIYEVRTWRYPHELSDPNAMFTNEVAWEDADASDAARLAFGMPPYERTGRVKSLNEVHQREQAVETAGCTECGFTPCECSRPLRSCDHHWVTDISPEGEGEFCRKCGIKRPPEAR